MSELISGKEAYNLIGQGVEVQAHVEYEKGLLEWQDAKELPACDILNGHFDFRLKPHTITINGVEYIDKQGAYEAFMEVYNEMDIHPDI